jgi:hypothetical protein
MISNLVSTIIPVHNRPTMLTTAVESVTTQDYSPVEIIIVDDGSTDSTAEVASDLVRKHPDKVRLIKQANRGPGPAREAGRCVAQGEFIQYLDSDDKLLPNKFRDQVHALKEHPGCGVAYGMTRLVGEGGVVLAEPFKWTGREYTSLFPALLVDRWWSTHTPLYRRSVCDAVGPWSDLKYSQDWEYDARVGALHTRLVFTGTYVSEHADHQQLRQTGKGQWLEPADQLHFFRSLLKCARQCGVVQGSKEIEHFARWVFARSRIAGAMGETVAAQDLFELAIDAAGRPDRSMEWFGSVVNVLGWRVTSTLTQLGLRLMRRKPGPGTLQQSWTEPWIR